MEIRIEFTSKIHAKYAWFASHIRETSNLTFPQNK